VKAAVFLCHVVKGVLPEVTSAGQHLAGWRAQQAVVLADLELLLVLPREVVESPSLESPSLEIFKTRLDKVLCSLL